MRAIGRAPVPHFDHARRQLRLKVVYYGPGLGGKTTNLEQIHARTRPEQRGKLIALEHAGERTLFFDLLPLELGRYRDYDLRVHLCTVPGQLASDAVRQLVLKHVDGVVLVVDSQRERLDDNLRSIQNLETNLRLQGDDPATLPMVVQLNKRDLPSALEESELREVLCIPAGVPQVSAVASKGVGVADTLKAIVRACLEMVPDPARAEPGRVPSILPGQRMSMFPEAEPSGEANPGRSHS